MSPNLGFDRFGGHLVQTLPQTELKKRISKYFGKRCTSIGTLRISISFLGFFFARSTESGPGLIYQINYPVVSFNVKRF